MSYNNNYNNNTQNNKPSVNVYTPISFSHPGSRVQDTRFTISYFNKVMQITISRRTNPGSNGAPTYDNDNPVRCHISSTKAKILHDDVLLLLKPGLKNNVSIELKDCLLKISNGAEFGSSNYCISIIKSTEAGEQVETVYETNSDSYETVLNYSIDDCSYESHIHPDVEIDTFIMVLNQYWLASSYAIAASIREASMYKDKFISDTLIAIAEKVGAREKYNGGNNSNRTFLSNNRGNVSTYNSAPVPKEYEQSTFADIAESIG